MYNNPLICRDYSFIITFNLQFSSDRSTYYNKMYFVDECNLEEVLTRIYNIYLDEYSLYEIETKNLLISYNEESKIAKIYLDVYINDSNSCEKQDI